MVVLRRVLFVLSVSASALAAGCEPDLDDRPSRVLGKRVLGVRTDPPELPPGGQGVVSALFVDTTGELPSDTWTSAVCRARKPLTELGPVNPSCVDPQSTDLVPAEGQPPVAAVPDDACRLFGPDPPDPKPGEPPGRPVDPDGTGGYALPVVVRFGPNAAETAVGAVRLTCGLAGATSDDLSVYLERRRPNQNPDPPRITLADDVPVTTLEAKRGEVVTFRAGWPSCPTTAACGDGVCSPDETVKACPEDCTTPKGCGGAEVYGRFDPSTRTNVLSREAMRVSWFATGGSFDAERTGRAGDDAASTTENAWTAPTGPGTVHVWAVLRDDRGGAAWSHIVVSVL